MNVKYSVVIPIKNEEENIIPLIEELEPIMMALKDPWELITVDDGSTDSSLKILQQLKQDKRYLRILSFTNNFGQSSAFDAGFKIAQGQFIITLDGDRQNDPHDIPRMLEAIDDADLICGWRKDRKDPLLKKIISKFANCIRSRFCQDGMHDTGCSLKIFKTEALKKIKLYHGMHRFLPALLKIEGLKVEQLAVNHRERTGGHSKYHFF